MMFNVLELVVYNWLLHPVLFLDHYPLCPLSLYRATLLITEHTVYAIKGSNKLQSDEVIALRVQDGTRLWNSQNGLYEKPLTVENNVLSVSGGENLSALNASTGELFRTQRIEGLSDFSALPDGGLYGFVGRLYLFCLILKTLVNSLPIVHNQS